MQLCRTFIVARINDFVKIKFKKRRIGTERSRNVRGKEMNGRSMIAPPKNECSRVMWRYGYSPHPPQAVPLPRWGRPRGGVLKVCSRVVGRGCTLLPSHPLRGSSPKGRALEACSRQGAARCGCASPAPHIVIPTEPTKASGADLQNRKRRFWE